MNQIPDPVVVLEKNLATEKKEEQPEGSSLQAQRLKDMSRKRKFDEAFKEQNVLNTKKQKLSTSVKKLEDKVRGMRKETSGRHCLRMIEYLQEHGNSLQPIGEDRFFRRYYWCPDFENCIYVANVGKNVNEIHDTVASQKGTELKQGVEVYSP